MHRSSEDNPIFTLGQIGEYIYIQADSLVEQHEMLTFEEIKLTDEEKAELHSQNHIKQAKATARGKIRGIKDLEDDLVDQKKIIQFMARGFAGLWASLPQDIKDANPYKDNFDLFSKVIVGTELRLDLETSQIDKISKIINDEVEFARIVKDEYISKL